MSADFFPPQTPPFSGVLSFQTFEQETEFSSAAWPTPSERSFTVWNAAVPSKKLIKSRTGEKPACGGINHPLIMRYSSKCWSDSTQSFQSVHRSTNYSLLLLLWFAGLLKTTLSLSCWVKHGFNNNTPTIWQSSRLPFATSEISTFLAPCVTLSAAPRSRTSCEMDACFSYNIHAKVKG